MEYLETIAVSVLNLKPDEFWELTPKEFRLLLFGHEVRQDEEMQKISILASWIIAPHTKRKVGAKKLYKPKNLIRKKNRRIYANTKILDDIEKRLLSSKERRKNNNGRNSS